MLSRICIRFQISACGTCEVLLNKAFYKKAPYSNTKRARACVRSFYSARECMYIHWLRERRFRVLSAQTTTNESFEVCASHEPGRRARPGRDESAARWSERYCYSKKEKKGDEPFFFLLRGTPRVRGGFEHVFGFRVRAR
jgi:hypothetical protein